MNKTTKRKLLLVWVLTLLTLGWAQPLLPAQAAPPTAPLDALNLDVLIVTELPSTSDNGRRWLDSDLAEIGCNVTWIETGVSYSVNYATDYRTSNLAQYDVIIVMGRAINNQPVSLTEGNLTHFTRFGGVLIWSQEAGFRVGGAWRSYDAGADAGTAALEARLGLDFTGLAYSAYLSTVYSDNGTFTLNTPSLASDYGFPSYINATIYGATSSYMHRAVPKTVGGSQAVAFYNFTEQFTPPKAPLPSIFYYKNSTGAIGWWINYRMLQSDTVGGRDHVTHGFVDGQYAKSSIVGGQGKSQRQQLLKAMLAYSYTKDYSTVIKRQPLAVWRQDDLCTLSFSDVNEVLWDSYRDSNRTYYDSNMMFSDFFLVTESASRTNARALALNKQYVDRLNEHLTYTELDTETQGQIETSIATREAARTTYGFVLSPTASAHGAYSPWTLMDRVQIADALAAKGFWLFAAGTRDTQQTGYSWAWNLTVMGTTNKVLFTRTEYCRAGAYTEVNAWYNYVLKRGEFAVAAHNFWAEMFFGHYDEVSNGIIKKHFATHISNITYEHPSIKFVSLDEASVYFAKKFVKLTSVSRTGNTITFNVDSSQIPSLTTIGKGMLWLRIDSALNIASMTVDGVSWQAFDDKSFRIPSTASSVSITLGSTPSTPRVLENEVATLTQASWDGSKLTAVVNSKTGAMSKTVINMGGYSAPKSVSGATSYTQQGSLLILYVRHSSPATLEILFSSSAEYSAAQSQIIQYGYIAIGIASVGFIILVAIALIQQDIGMAYAAVLAGLGVTVGLFVTMYILNALSGI